MTQRKTTQSMGNAHQRDETHVANPLLYNSFSGNVELIQVN